MSALTSCATALKEKTARKKAKTGVTGDTRLRISDHLALEFLHFLP